MSLQNAPINGLDRNKLAQVKTVPVNRAPLKQPRGTIKNAMYSVITEIMSTEEVQRRMSEISDTNRISSTIASCVNKKVFKRSRDPATGTIYIRPAHLLPPKDHIDLGYEMLREYKSSAPVAPTIKVPTEFALSITVSISIPGHGVVPMTLADANKLYDELKTLFTKFSGVTTE